MLKIGEFSKLSRVSVRMLRHYDEVGLLAPSEVDPMTGYRYYSERQLITAGRIAALRAPFEQARKAENAGKHVFAGLREGRFATEGAGALLLAACMCGLEGSFNSEFRLDDVLSVIV